MSRMRTPALGAVVAGIAASSCCIVPMILALLGVGGAGLGGVLARYRPLFFGVTVVLVAIALWLAHRRWRASSSEQGGDCCAVGRSRGRLWPTWAMSAIALGIAALPFAMGGSVEPAVSCTDRVELSVRGMTCAGCEAHITEALVSVPGVLSAGASYEHGTAWACLASHPAGDALTAAVARAGYEATMVASPAGKENAK